MFQRTVVLFLLQFTAAFSIYQGTTEKRGEYANIQGEVEFSPAIGDDGILADMTQIHSMHRCVHHCLSKDLCRTVTYYEDLKNCRLYSIGSSQGTIQSRANTKVIELVDRSKKRDAKYC